MIGYVKGNVLWVENGTVLIENGGIGYEITCSSSVYAKLMADRYGEVYTYMAVREDGVSLYGFNDMQEKSIFLKLISVSGVGPKMGIMVLSNMSVQALVLAIATSNVKALSQVKGLGKKTAERIILELREKVGTADTETGEIIVGQPVEEMPKESDDAILALLSLGFSRAECLKAVKEAYANGAKTVEELIAYAIKHIK